jgi:hypothetical protein
VLSIKNIEGLSSRNIVDGHIAAPSIMHLLNCYESLVNDPLSMLVANWRLPSSSNEIELMSTRGVAMKQRGAPDRVLG